MKAIIVYPPKAGVWLKEIDFKEKVGSNGVLVRTLENGMCGTDRGIVNGTLTFSRPPDGYDFLVLGHETLGIVEEVGDAVNEFKKGDIVVPIVRRGCNSCFNCIIGRQDYCETGKFREIGIRGLHGTMREYFTDNEENLVKIPSGLRHVGVLLEPLSNIMKTFEEIELMQRRMIWNCNDSSYECRNAAILGSGPIGLLFALMSASKGFEVFVMNKREPFEAELKVVEAIGAKFIDTTKDELGEIDLLIDTTGYPSAFIPLLKKIKNNGVLVLFGTASGDQYNLSTEDVNHIVESNIAIIGAVNASKKNFIEGAEYLNSWNSKYPGVLESMITKKLKPEDSVEYLKNKPKGEIKTIITW